MIKDFTVEVEEFFRISEKSSTFLITSTARADGDSIASQLILLRLIKELKQGKNYRIDVINESSCPKAYMFLSGSKLIFSVDKAEFLPSYDVGIVTDCGPERTGKLQPVFEKCGYQIVIDHHAVSQSNNCNLKLIDPNASSTVEIIYSFIEHPLLKTQLDQDLAELFYVGLIFDTGSFQYPLTTSRTLRIAASLLDTGINFSVICEKVLLEKTLQAQRLLGHVLTNMETTPDESISWAVITRKTMERLGATHEDQEGIVNNLNFIKSVKVAVLFIEVEANEWKLSMRSRGYVNVAILANTLNPKGGGHERAAGCHLSGSEEYVKSTTIQAIKDMMEKSASP